jgi:non-specific serine/threonine protein kinase
LWRFWQTRGHVREGRTWLDAALRRHAGDAAPEALAARAKALSVAGNLAWIQKDEAAAAALHDESVAIWRALGDEVGVLRGLFLRGLVAQHQDDVALMGSLTEQALPLFATPGAAVWVGATIVNQGVLAQRTGDYDRAAAHFADATARYERLGFRWGIAWILGHRARLARDVGDVAGAIADAQASLGIYRDHRDTWGVVEEVSDLAAFAAAAGRMADAARLFGATEALREAIGIPVTPTDLDAQRGAVATVRAALGEASFAIAWGEGRALPLAEAIAAALADLASPAAKEATPTATASPEGLTPRELEVLRLLAAGKSNQEIGDALFISPRTAGTHVANILGKLDVGTRVAAVALAHQRGIV